MAVQSKSAISNTGYKTPAISNDVSFPFDLICLEDDRAFSLLHQEFPQILVPVVTIVKKIGVTEKTLEKARVKLLRDMTEKSVY